MEENKTFKIAKAEWMRTKMDNKKEKMLYVLNIL
jgi:hypothetical protein